MPRYKELKSPIPPLSGLAKNSNKSRKPVVLGLGERWLTSRVMFGGLVTDQMLEFEYIYNITRVQFKRPAKMHNYALF